MKKFGRRKLTVELLERRDLMAVGEDLLLNVSLSAGTGGNVTAEVINGKLLIHGDGTGNSIGIYQEEGDSFYLESPNDKSTVNGQSTGFQYFSENGGIRGLLGGVRIAGVTRGIEIDMGDGDDWVSFYGRALGDVKITTGSGNDSILLGGEPYSSPLSPITATIKYPQPATIEGNLAINMGDGNDLLSPFANVVGDATIQLGAGDDGLLQPTETIYGIEIPKKLVVTGTLSIDLGPPEPDSDWAADWRNDAALVSKIHPDVVSAFERFAAAKQAGEIGAASEWIWRQEDGDPAARFSFAGRLQIEFTYYAGDLELIDRLQARGMQIERHANDQGLAYASIRESDLALFGNLPTLASVDLRGVAWGGRLPFEFDNAGGPNDVDGDGSINPNDALIVINALDGGIDLPLDSRTDIPAGYHVDVNQDGLLTPIDALRVINQLIRLWSSPTSFPLSALASSDNAVPPSDLPQQDYLLSLDEISDDVARLRRSSLRTT